MKKIPTYFIRDPKTHRVVNVVHAGCEWVANGEGIATRKFDGACCMIRGGKLYKRYELKPGGTPPPDFEPATELDENTGKIQGWLPVGNGPDDRWFREAGVILDWPLDSLKPLVPVANAPDGTYELLGPKIQGNPEGFAVHVLLPHGKCPIADVPRDYDGLKEDFKKCNIEGIVWHHPDGRMCKLKIRDFGIKRKSV